MDAQKKLVLVLNKIDLIPSGNLIEWVKHLRREFPTVQCGEKLHQIYPHVSDNSLNTHEHTRLDCIQKQHAETGQ